MPRSKLKVNRSQQCSKEIPNETIKQQPQGNKEQKPPRPINCTEPDIKTLKFLSTLWIMQSIDVGSVRTFPFMKIILKHAFNIKLAWMQWLRKT